MSGCVVKYDGKRGVSWSIKYNDAHGRQIKKVVGRESDGWTRKMAQAELDYRLGRVDLDHEAHEIGLLVNALRGREMRFGLRGRGDLSRAYAAVRKAAQELDRAETTREAREALGALHRAEDLLIAAAREERGAKVG